MKKALQKLVRILAGTALFVALNIGIAENVPAWYNLAATIGFFLIAGTWLLLSEHRPRRRSYEPLNRR